MFALLEGIFTFITGLFTTGGFFAGVATFFGTWFSRILSRIGEVWSYLFAYHTVEILRRILFISFISVVFGYVLNYAFTNLLVFEGQSLSALLNSYINSIANFGPVGIDFLAFATRIGFFDSLKIIFDVMLFTLLARVALSILFK